jgi:hypothetical protein
MSITGIPSVMQTTSSTPASTASKIESVATAAGTKTIERYNQFLSCFPHGIEHWHVLVEHLAALSGRDASDVRAVIHALARVKRTGAPVIPCTTSRVFLTRTDMIK